eukprot:scaffold487_cov344-Prasinococcus_capsulatus_cf.AAC.15
MTVRAEGLLGSGGLAGIAPSTLHRANIQPASHAAPRPTSQSLPPDLALRARGRARGGWPWAPKPRAEPRRATPRVHASFQPAVDPCVHRSRQPASRPSIRPCVRARAQLFEAGETKPRPGAPAHSCAPSGAGGWGQAPATRAYKGHGAAVRGSQSGCGGLDWGPHVHVARS